MPNPRLAARYAKSLIDLAIEKDQLESVYTDMQYMHGLTEASPELVRVLKSPVIQGEKKEKILDALTKGKLGVISSSFNRLLVRKGRESHLPEIVSTFIKQYKDYKGIHIVTLTTAVAPSEEVKSFITGRLMSSTIASGLPSSFNESGASPALIVCSAPLPKCSTIFGHVCVLLQRSRMLCAGKLRRAGRCAA